MLLLVPSGVRFLREDELAFVKEWRDLGVLSGSKSSEDDLGLEGVILLVVEAAVALIIWKPGALSVNRSANSSS